MSAVSRIRTALKSIMPENETNACSISKNYEFGTGRDGWHYTPFGGNPVWLGKSLADALETIEQMAAQEHY